VSICFEKRIMDDCESESCKWVHRIHLKRILVWSSDNLGNVYREGFRKMKEHLRCRNEDIVDECFISIFNQIIDLEQMLKSGVGTDALHTFSLSHNENCSVVKCKRSYRVIKNYINNLLKKRMELFEEYVRVMELNLKMYESKLTKICFEREWKKMNGRKEKLLDRFGHISESLFSKESVVTLKLKL
jgi:hypothetical protein